MEKVSLNNLSDFAQRVLGQIEVMPHDASRAFVVALHGDLGAGKTTFTQVLGRQLGIIEPMQSPTYVLMKSYSIELGSFKKLIHIDAYRLETPEQFNALRPEEFLSDPNNLVLIEWPERVAGVLPTPNLTIKFSSDGASEGERFVEIQ